MEQIQGTIARIRTTKHNLKHDTKFIIANIVDSWGNDHTIRGTMSHRPEIGDFISGNFERETHEKYGEQLNSSGHIDLFLPRDVATIKRRCREIAKRDGIPFTPPTMVKVIESCAENNPIGFWVDFVNYAPPKNLYNAATLQRIGEIQKAIKEYISQRKTEISSAPVEKYFADLGLSWSSAVIRRMLRYDIDANDEDPENPDREPILLTQLKADPLCIIELTDIRTTQVVQYLDALKRLAIIDEPTASVGEFIKECLTNENNGSCCIPVNEERVAPIRALPVFVKYLTEYNNCLYREKVFEEEKTVSNFFVDCATSEPLAMFDDDGILKQLRELPPDNGRIPNAKQLLAVNACLTSRISTIQGSAGTGKTTALRLLARYFKEDREDLRGNILFLAPTGKAVNRIKESLNDIELTASDNIMTIHRFAGLLRKHFNVPETQTQTNTEQCVSSPVLIVIDESSMISLSTIAMFVNVVRMYTTTPHIIFLGDMVQLSPVGYGSPFMDLIESDIATNTTLDVVHRQGSGSALLTAITDLRNAVQVSVSEPGLFEISLMKDVVKPMLRWIDLVGTSSSSSVIIVPTRSLVGKLTPIVRDYINPSSPEVDLFLDDDKQELLEKYRKGDKIMQIKNNYGRSVFNGEMGVVVDLLKHPEEDIPYRLHVTFDGHEGDFYYSLSDAEEELTLAYVLNTHKAQGSEYDDVLIIMDQVIPNFIHRNHIYTAASRGKKSVKILITAREIMRLWKFTPMKPVTQMVQQIKDRIV